MTLDEAARELAEATRARYVQPNGTVVSPTVGRLYNRRFWDAMAAYERARQECFTVGVQWGRVVTDEDPD